LSKDFVHHSMNLCAVLAVLAPKMDGSWRMCVDNRTIDNDKITLKYRVPISRLEDMLGCFVGSSWFFRIYLHSVYYTIIKFTLR